MSSSVNKVLIAGGGTAGWMAAAMLARLLGKQVTITVVESSEIGTVGVGEATIPPIQLFNKVLGINEKDFLKATGGTIKLGVEFNGWGKPDDNYMHAFGGIGRELGMASFQHYWQRAAKAGKGGSFWDYSLNDQAAKAGKFAPLEQTANASMAGLTYAYHFDATRYAEYLKKYCRQQNVAHIEGTIEEVVLDESSGFIQALALTDGRTVDGDFFIDCTGGRALLIAKALGVGFDDYQQWLPCDRAIAVASEPLATIAPFTRTTAHGAGWCWQIPLTHRTGNGIVYNHASLSDDAALAELQQRLPSRALGEPKLIKFRTGHRRQPWYKNCVALGLASGFLEPLESTSLHLIQSGIIRLVKLFPRQTVREADSAEYNRQAKTEFEAIRDFIILHYHLNQRPEPFWRACRATSIPESLARRIELFRRSGQVFRECDELFSEEAWQQVMLGQGVVPEDYHPIVDSLTDAQLDEFLANVKTIVRRTAEQLPSHHDFLKTL